MDQVMESRASAVADRYVPLLRRAISDNAAIDSGAKEALRQLATGEEAEKISAIVLVAGVEIGALDGIGRTGSASSGRQVLHETRETRLIGSGRKGEPLSIELTRQTGQASQSLKTDLVETAAAMRGIVGSTPPATVLANANPWLCAFICGLCAAAILDGAPGDEVVVCGLCVNACARGSA